MKCQDCGSTDFIKNGKDQKTQRQKYKCKNCGSDKYPIDDKTLISKPSLSEVSPMTEEQLRAKYDLSFIVQTALSQLEKGQFLNKEMLLKRCKLSASAAGVSATIHAEQFKPYRGKAKGGDIIFGHPDRIRTLIEETVLFEI